MTKYLLIFRWPALLVLLFGLGMAGCASDKNLVAHTFNNIAARDNAYFLAREKLRETEAKLYAARQNDYNQVLPLFPTLDSAAVKANRAELNDIIKKASLPIQHRPGSDWTDDAYLLVGWSRYYQMQYSDAALTFKYVNSTSKDNNAKHEALIGLMRTFVALQEYDNAKAVSDLLDKESGQEKNARELFLTRADYYLKTGEPAKAIPQLERAIPMIEFKNERSRTRYILAQLYQEAGEDKKAYEQLNQILARNPPYELDFFAKLMLGQVSDLNLQDKARLNKYFAALLKDPKNKDYRDKIYYEMARLSYRQQNYPDALQLLRQSIKATTTNQKQKGYTYLLAGRIYYENLQKYRLAAAYYDSTVQAMSKEAPNYAAIKERSDILQDFAKQYTIIETQDSLQTLARLNKDELDQQLDAYAEAELAARRKEAEKQAAAEKARAREEEFASRRPNEAPSAFGGSTRPDPTAFDPTAAGGAKWYFDNPATLGTARADFIRRWGNRQLQDNWRTRNTPASATPGAIAGAGGAAGAQPGGALSGPDAAKQDSLAKAAAANPEAEKQALVAKYRQDLPLTPEQLAASDKLIEAAMYELGGIYKEQLKEKEKGIATYEKEVTRYPRGEHAPDAYYLLYLYYKDKPDPAKMAEYAAALQREFPKSIYAKLIIDPLYREHEQALRKAVAARLDSAFTLYKDQEFTKARAVLARTEKQFPKHELTDRVAYLKTLLVIRTQPPMTARAAVEKFYKEYPDSPLVPLARDLATTYRKQETGQITGALASTDKPVVSQFRPGEVDNRLRIMYSDTEMTTPAPPPAPAKDEARPLETLTPKDQAPAPAGSAGPAPAPSRNALEPAPAPAEPAPSTGTMPTPAAPTGATTASAPAAAPTTAYTTQLSAAHAVVLVFPKAAPAPTDLATQLGAYNNRFFRANNLQVQPQPLGAEQDLLVVRALPGAKVAQSYATKLRGPQSPLARLRGQGYQTLVITLDNLTLLQTTGDLAGYLTYYQGAYK
ncbi:hypothetical protein [Hymenobacter saemangeumensis]|uniref:type IX secretion system periplasmic lipoprotein PorW/SprE n=1 Tax=Hymenobacter saemangeumensis TaxID=1084522 RepID=UPI0031EBD855